MKIIELLQEAVGGDYVYHSVSDGKTAEAIMRSGVIKPSLADTDADAGETRPVISTSRDQFYRYPYGGGKIQFVLDRQALRAAGFKVEPFSYRKFFNEPSDTPVTGNELHKQEAEERVYHPKGIGIPVKKPYVVAIQLHPDLDPTKVPKIFRQRAAAAGLELQSMKKGKELKNPNALSDPSRLGIADNSYSVQGQKFYHGDVQKFQVVYRRQDEYNSIETLSSDLPNRQAAEKELEKFKQEIEQHGEIKSVDVS